MVGTVTRLENKIGRRKSDGWVSHSSNKHLLKVSIVAWLYALYPYSSYIWAPYILAKKKKKKKLEFTFQPPLSLLSSKIIIFGQLYSTPFYSSSLALYPNWPTITSVSMLSCMPKGNRYYAHIMHPHRCVCLLLHTRMHITAPLVLLELAGPAPSDYILFDISFLVKVNCAWLSFYYGHSGMDLHIYAKEKTDNTT